MHPSRKYKPIHFSVLEFEIIEAIEKLELKGIKWARNQEIQDQFAETITRRQLRKLEADGVLKSVFLYDLGELGWGLSSAGRELTRLKKWGEIGWLIP